VAITQRTKRHLRACLVTGLIASGVGLGYARIIGGTDSIGVTIGFSIGLSLSAFELFYVQGQYGARLRGLPLPLYVLITTLCWAIILCVLLMSVPYLMQGYTYGARYTASTFRQDFLFALAVSLVFNSGLRLRALVGGRVLLNFLLGRYNRPVREERVFMFLDLADSTPLAEKMGDLAVQSLIGRFFFDIARPIAEHHGETHRYIGDEVVVTWPLEDVLHEADCVRCVFDIQALIKDKAGAYEAEFGVVPEFRIGIHGGSVVAGEVGDEKREIVYFGDTINTAARLQSLCKDFSCNVLISRSLLDKMHLPHDVEVEELGSVEVRGKAERLDVCTMFRRPAS
jgi:adenylate cyclase